VTLKDVDVLAGAKYESPAKVVVSVKGPVVDPSVTVHDATPDAFVVPEQPTAPSWKLTVRPEIPPSVGESVARNVTGFDFTPDVGPV
jgi:hypothetical protein